MKDVSICLSEEKLYLSECLSLDCSDIYQRNEAIQSVMKPFKV